MTLPVQNKLFNCYLLEYRRSDSWYHVLFFMASASKTAVHQNIQRDKLTTYMYTDGQSSFLHLLPLFSDTCKEQLAPMMFPVYGCK